MTVIENVKLLGTQETNGSQFLQLLHKYVGTSNGSSLNLLRQLDYDYLPKLTFLQLQFSFIKAGRLIFQEFFRA